MNKSGQHVMKGIFLAAVASTMWGISGTILQFISQNQALPAAWFLSTRTLGAGVALLLISAVVYKKRVFAVFTDWVTFGWLLAYAFLGLAANLLTFYMSVQTGNSATSTVLQYLSPLFIVLGSLIFKREAPLRSDLVAFFLSLVGVLLALTRGDFSQLAIPVNSFIWGLGSGITAAFYVVFPRPVAKKAPALVVLGWGSLIASLGFNLYHPVWVNVPPVSPSGALSIALVILVGTILPFSLLIHSSHYAPSDVISIMDAVQPVTTFILSVLFLSLHPNFWELVGTGLVIVAIYLLQRGRKRINEKSLLD